MSIDIEIALYTFMFQATNAQQVLIWLYSIYSRPVSKPIITSPILSDFDNLSARLGINLPMKRMNQESILYHSYLTIAKNLSCIEEVN